MANKNSEANFPKISTRPPTVKIRYRGVWFATKYSRDYLLLHERITMTKRLATTLFITLLSFLYSTTTTTNAKRGSQSSYKNSEKIQKANNNDGRSNGSSSSSSRMMMKAGEKGGKKRGKKSSGSHEKKSGKKKGNKGSDEGEGDSGRDEEFRGFGGKKGSGSQDKKRGKKKGKGGSDKGKKGDGEKDSDGVIEASQELRDAVTIEGLHKHLEAFQNAAEGTVGIRSVGTVGYELSAEYVYQTLVHAGYDVFIQNYFVDLFEILRPANMGLVGGLDYIYATDFYEFDYIRSAFLEARTESVPNYGCDDEDFVDFVGGNIAIIMRTAEDDGECDFVDQSVNAEAAGAVGVVIYNDEERENAFFETFVQYVVGIPVFGSSYQTGLELAFGIRLRMSANVLNIEDVATTNIIAETAGGNEKHVVMVGAHLDSVAKGPGINDNASGSAAILEIAVQMATLGIQPRNKVRFGWWGAKEIGLLGSRYYVSNLSVVQQEQIALYLNFDTIASPNFVRAVYAPELEGEEGIAQVFIDYFDAYNLSYVPLDDILASLPNGQTDHYSFQTEARIPSSGIFAGGTSIKTEQQAAFFGGNAGEPLDPCYNEACDDIDNINTMILKEMSDAAAHAIFTFADMHKPDFRRPES